MVLFLCKERRKMERKTTANDYKILCSEANKMLKMKNGSITSNGWYKIDGEQDRKSNFKGVLFEKDGQYAICFVGTDRTSTKDWGANFKMATTGNSRQIEIAKNFTNTMRRKHYLNNENTISIGHSEGGTEATEVGVENAFKTITFNAYGISKKHLSPYQNYDNLVTNYRDPHDPVSKLKSNIGTTYIVPSTQNSIMSKTPFGSIQAHGINNMGDCNNAIPVKEYKKSNPLFIDKISDKDISRQDIKEMDSNLFRIYEKEIDNRLANNQIKSSKESNSRNSSSGQWVTINGNHVLLKK